MVGTGEERHRIVGGGITATLRHTGPDRAELEVAGELDGPAVERLRAELPLRESHRLVVDLSGVTFMASGGINWLVGLQRRLDQLLVRSPSPIVLRVLEITGVADVLAIDGGPDLDGGPVTPAVAD